MPQDVWEFIGYADTPEDAVDPLNQCGNSAEVALNNHDKFAIWGIRQNPHPQREWRLLERGAKGDDARTLADKMNEHGLDANCVIVSRFKDNKWALWGYVHT